MPRHAKYLPNGVIPAILLPFDDDLAIDESAFRRAHQRRRGDRGHLRADHQRALDRGRLLHVRRATPRARHRAGRDRRQDCRWCTASGPTAVSRPRASPGWRRPAAPRRCWSFRRRRSRWDRPRDGARAFPAHRRCYRSAADRLPVSAGDRAGLSARHAAARCATRCRRSAPSRTGRTTCRSTSGTCARCNRCRAR